MEKCHKIRSSVHFNSDQARWTAGSRRGTWRATVREASWSSTAESSAPGGSRSSRSRFSSSSRARGNTCRMGAGPGTPRQLRHAQGHPSTEGQGPGQRRTIPGVGCGRAPSQTMNDPPRLCEEQLPARRSAARVVADRSGEGSRWEVSEQSRGELDAAAGRGLVAGITWRPRPLRSWGGVSRIIRLRYAAAAVGQELHQPPNWREAIIDNLLSSRTWCRAAHFPCIICKAYTVPGASAYSTVSAAIGTGKTPACGS